MKKTKNIFIILIGIIIIIAGIIMTVIKGFNFDIRYEGGKRLEITIGKKFENSEIEEIAKQEIGTDVLVQKIEIYEDAVTISAKDITEEQKNNIVTKINEKYGTELTEENSQIIIVPHARLRDLAKPYILPFIISTVIILVYMMIRYYKLHIVKVLAKTLGIVLLWQVLLFSVISITRIPIGRLTIPMVLTIYILSFVYCTSKFEKQLAETKISEEKK